MCSFQSFQRNLIKGITPVVQLETEVKLSTPKKPREEAIPLNGVYDLTVDTQITLLGNSVYESMGSIINKEKSVLIPSQKMVFLVYVIVSVITSCRYFAFGCPTCLRTDHNSP